ncbi:MAG TPA: hypothetical protein VF085_09215, partial [Solirubrobacterales bacterium]
PNIAKTRAITEIAPGMPKRLRSGENIKSLSLSREPHCRAASLGGPPGARFSLLGASGRLPCRRRCGQHKRNGLQMQGEVFEKKEFGS